MEATIRTSSITRRPSSPTIGEGCSSGLPTIRRSATSAYPPSTSSPPTRSATRTTSPLASPSRCSMPSSRSPSRCPTTPKSSCLGSVLESDLAYPEQLADDTVATEYTSVDPDLPAGVMLAPAPSSAPAPTKPLPTLPRVILDGIPRVEQIEGDDASLALAAPPRVWRLVILPCHFDLDAADRQNEPPVETSPAANDADVLAPFDPGPEFASHTSVRVCSRGAEVADLSWKFGLNGALHYSDYGVPTAAFLAKLCRGTGTSALLEPSDAALRRAKHFHSNDFANKLGGQEADLYVRLMGCARYGATSNQLVIEGKACLDARLLFEEMPNQNTTTAHSIHSVSSLPFSGAANFCEGHRIFMEVFGPKPVLLELLLAENKLPWPPPVQFVLLGDGVQLRPTPWPSFIGPMLQYNTCLVHKSCHLLLSEAYPSDGVLVTYSSSKCAAYTSLMLLDSEHLEQFVQMQMLMTAPWSPPVLMVGCVTWDYPDEHELEVQINQLQQPGSPLAVLTLQLQQLGNDAAAPPDTCLMDCPAADNYFLCGTCCNPSRSTPGPAIVVLQDVAEHKQPRYFTVNFAHAYSTDGATVWLCSATIATHAAQRVFEELSAQNTLLLEPLLAMVDKGPLPPHLKDHNTLITSTMELRLVLCQSLSLCWVAELQVPPWPPPVQLEEMHSTGIQLRPVPVQWIESLVVVGTILPKPPWSAFDLGTLFKVVCSCSNTRASLQYALQLSFDSGNIQSQCYLREVTYTYLWHAVFSLIMLPSAWWNFLCQFETLNVDHVHQVMLSRNIKLSMHEQADRPEHFVVVWIYFMELCSTLVAWLRAVILRSFLVLRQGTTQQKCGGLFGHAWHKGNFLTTNQEFMLLDLCFLTTNKEVQYSSGCLSDSLLACGLDKSRIVWDPGAQFMSFMHSSSSLGQLQHGVGLSACCLQVYQLQPLHSDAMNTWLELNLASVHVVFDKRKLSSRSYKEQWQKKIFTLLNCLQSSIRVPTLVYAEVSCAEWTPWLLPALVEFTDDGLDIVVDDDADEDYEHAAEDTVLASSTVEKAAAPPALTKTTGRNLSKRRSKQVIAQFLWDPGGTEILHRLGGKPKLKKGGMSAYDHGLMGRAAHASQPRPRKDTTKYYKSNNSCTRRGMNQSNYKQPKGC